MKKWILLLLVLVSANVSAEDWKLFEGAKIQGIMQWEDAQDGGRPVYIRLSPDTYCWVPAAEKNMIALIMSLHASGKTADFHCRPAVDAAVGGVPAYRLHRVNSN